MTGNFTSPIPTEILSQIIAFIDDPSSLLATSLVNSVCLSITRRITFRQITVKTTDDNFLDLTDSPRCSLVHHAHKLHLRNYETDFRYLKLRIAEILKPLPLVKWLCFSNATHFEHDYRVRLSRKKKFQSLSPFDRIETLVLKAGRRNDIGFIEDLFLMFPEVRKFECRGLIGYDYGYSFTTPDVPPTPSTLPKLTEFVCRTKDTEFLDKFIKCAHVERIRVLSLDQYSYDFDRDSPSYMSSLLKCTGPGLQILTLSFTRMIGVPADFWSLKHNPHIHTLVFNTNVSSQLWVAMVLKTIEIRRLRRLVFNVKYQNSGIGVQRGIKDALDSRPCIYGKLEEVVWNVQNGGESTAECIILTVRESLDMRGWWERGILKVNVS